ncbi:MAG: hypothetical protein LQ347_003788 [Umbilicaria vellea]|nr:MAG: hypothetical protein LQ347_003788 [Umbilicaria vellea]
MRLASFALLTASAISLITAAPAPPADPNIFNLPGSVSQGGNKVVLPATNLNINRQDISNLTPSKTLTLQYAEGITSGTYAASLKFKMIYPQAVLENSALVTTLDCSKDSQTMTIVFQSKAAYDVAALWPQTKLVLITNNAACNPSTERGIYMVNSRTGNANTLTIVLKLFVYFKGYIEDFFNFVIYILQKLFNIINSHFKNDFPNHSDHHGRVVC